MATTATRVLDNYIAGRWTPATGATDELDVTNPATGEVLARVPLSGSADLDAAVDAARAALKPWREVSTIARARKLFASLATRTSPGRSRPRWARRSSTPAPRWRA
jgi:malonate-semialdehyde dehydrogenase (acetylating) / methylmalonate-semialdehyde dehydrogenase